MYEKSSLALWKRQEIEIRYWSRSKSVFSSRETIRGPITTCYDSMTPELLSEKSIKLININYNWGSQTFFHVKIVLSCQNNVWNSQNIGFSKEIDCFGGDLILPFEDSDIIALYSTRVPGNDSYWMTMCGLTQGKLLEGGILSCRWLAMKIKKLSDWMSRINKNIVCINAHLQQKHNKMNKIKLKRVAKY